MTGINTSGKGSSAPVSITDINKAESAELQHEHSFASIFFKENAKQQAKPNASVVEKRQHASALDSIQEKSSPAAKAQPADRKSGKIIKPDAADNNVNQYLNNDSKLVAAVADITPSAESALQFAQFDANASPLLTVDDQPMQPEPSAENCNTADLLSTTDNTLLTAPSLELSYKYAPGVLKDKLNSTEVKISTNQSSAITDTNIASYINNGFEDQQDFSGFLSGSLAKVAAMQERDVNSNLPALLIPNAPPALMQRIAVNPSSHIINSFFGSSGWHQEISQKVVWMLAGSDQSATLTLNPPDLGPLQVVVSVNNEQADTRFISDNPEVRQALAQGLATLREMMHEAGIELGRADISAGHPQQASTNDSGDSGQSAPSKFNADIAPDSIEKNLDQPLQAGRQQVVDGLVDTFA